MNSRLLTGIVLAAVLLASCGAPSPTPQPAPVPTTRGYLAVTLASDAPRYAAPAEGLRLTLTNDGAKPIYLRICGPWEIFDIGDPDRPVWTIACEIDYLGHLVEPYQAFSGDLEPGLEPGIYQARMRVYGDCALRQPQAISPTETYYGAFSDCAVFQDVVSPPFEVE